MIDQKHVPIPTSIQPTNNISITKSCSKALHLPIPSPARVNLNSITELELFSSAPYCNGRYLQHLIGSAAADLYSVEVCAATAPCFLELSGLLERRPCPLTGYSSLMKMSSRRILSIDQNRLLFPFSLSQSFTHSLCFSLLAVIQ
jgi:hypothetical protein